MENKETTYEGIFDGIGMITPRGEKFAVPANYASKSKLIGGDGLLLTITQDGEFIYKQLCRVNRKRVVGTVILEDRQYKVISEGKKYDVLLAAISFYGIKPGDRVSLIVQVEGLIMFGAIDNVLPKF